MPGALVAADPPASRAFPAGAVPRRGQKVAEGPQVAAVEDVNSGGDEGGARARVQRRGVAERVAPGRGAADAGDVLVKVIGRARAGDQVPAVRPGSVEQAADEPEVGEVPGGRGRLADAHGVGWLLGLQYLEQPVLQGEQVIGGQGIFSGPGRGVEPGPAGAGVPAGGLGLEGRPALGGVQAAVVGARDQPGGRSGHGWLLAGRAQVFKQPPVRRAGEHDRQPPCLLPGTAVLLLDVAAVSGQALRAVPRRGGEQPRAGERPGIPLVGGDPRCRPRIPAGDAARAQASDLGCGEPGGAGEGPGQGLVQVQHQAPAGRLVTAAAGSEAGELHDAGRGEPEPVREPQQVAGQGLIRQRVQAARQRAQLVHRVSFPVMARPPSLSKGRGRRRRCCARACASRFCCRLAGQARAGWRGSRQLRRRGCARRGG